MLIQISVEKKLEVDEAEGYRKPIFGGKNLNLALNNLEVSHLH